MNSKLGPKLDRDPVSRLLALSSYISGRPAVHSRGADFELRGVVQGPTFFGGTPAA